MSRISAGPIAQPEPPIIAETTQPCSTCGQPVTRTATTEEEKRALYERLQGKDTCEECSNAAYKWLMDY
jgi:hypothetical protein